MYMGNNKTVKKFNIVLKLKGDNVYDLYLDDEWIASRGSCDNILEVLKDEIRKSFLKEENN